jgi:DNA-directed RNA polymerase specialized sigma24 family protein
LVDKLIRQTGVAPIEEAEGVRLRGRIGTYARFVELYRRRVRRLALEESDEPWNQAAVKRGGEAVVGAIRSLPLELREAVLIVVLAGFSHSDAAQALDIPPARLLERLERARERLAAHMGARSDLARERAWLAAPHLTVIK